MFDKAFVATQDRLYGWYNFIRFMRKPVLLIGIFLFGMFAAIYDVNRDDTASAIAQLVEWATIILAVIIGIVLRTMRLNLEKRLWSQLRSDEYRFTYLSSPLLRNGTTSISSKLLASSTYRNSEVTIHSAKNRYLLNRRLRPGGLTLYGFEYLVVKVKLPTNVPHIFIDGLSQNLFSFKNTNLWSLSRKVSKKQEMQKLEGNFSKYFSVYVAPSRQIDTLSILVPDTMLALRDSGYNFDYELYKDNLFIIHEPKIYNTDEMEAFLTAIDGVVDELVPQLEKFSLSMKPQQLMMNTSALTFWACVNTLLIMFYYSFLILVPLLAGDWVGRYVFA